LRVDIFHQVMDSDVVRTKHDLQSLLSLPVRQKTTLYTLAAHIMSRLAPLLVSRVASALLHIVLVFYYWQLVVQVEQLVGYVCVCVSVQTVLN